MSNLEIIISNKYSCFLSVVKVNFNPFTLKKNNVTSACQRFSVFESLPEEHLTLLKSDFLPID